MTTSTPDPWPAIDELANMVNDLASAVQAQGQHLQEEATSATKKRGIVPAEVQPEALRTWVEDLVQEYGLHSKIGPPERWEAIPPLRAELLGLMIADVRYQSQGQGSFELVYWHDALSRVIGRVEEHVDRWKTNAQNRRLLEISR